MLQSQYALKRFPTATGRLPGPEAPFRSGAGISVLGALRFELQWLHRNQELPREKQGSHE